MNRKTVCWFMLVLFAVFSAYSQQYDDENDFGIVPLDGGKSAMIIRYTGTKQTVRIPAKIRGMNVTMIGNYAFWHEGGNPIISVTIPNSVTYIGDYAFAYNQLTDVIIPDSVTYIGDFAFNFNQLTSIVIPNSVTYIGDGAFAGGDIANKLTSVIIPNSVTYIGNSAFAANRLTSVIIPNSVTYIGVEVFAGNQLTSVFIPNSVTSIGVGAFISNKLTGVVIPNSVTSIGDYAFHSNQLTSVVIPNSVTSIGVGAFDFAYYDNRAKSLSGDITTFTIGYNVSIKFRPFESDMDQFVTFYNNNGKRAGTYVFVNGKWSMR